jgi:hypothetical protein
MRESTEGKRNGIQWTMWQQLDDLDAFSKSTKLRNKEVFHSNDCSIIIRSAAIWSVHDRSFLKPACCSLSFSSTAFNRSKLTESFDVKTGVKQGCLLSPFLFLLAIDYIMRESTEGKRNGYLDRLVTFGIDLHNLGLAFVWS